MQISFRVSTFVLFCSLSAIGQSGAAAAQNGGNDRGIKLDVVVTDKANKPVAGLQQQAFTVLDNKRPAKVLSFQAQTSTAATPDSPIEIILVFDEINTPFSRMRYADDEASRFLSQNGGKLDHPVSLAFVSDTGTQQTNASTDGNALMKVVTQHETAIRQDTKDSGVGASEDRVSRSLKAIDALAASQVEKPGRKMVIWISPGWPAMDGRRQDLSGSQSKAMFSAVLYTTTALRLARITLYSVDPMGLNDSDINRRAFYLDFLKGVPDANQVQLANMSLQVFATQSGGQVLYGYNSLVDAFVRCVADLDAFYTFTIDTAPADRPNEYHAIEIKVADKSLKVHAPSGYYAQPH